MRARQLCTLAMLLCFVAGCGTADEGSAPVPGSPVVELDISGMADDSDGEAVAKTLARIDGVAQAGVDVANGTARIELKPREWEIADLVRVFQAALDPPYELTKFHWQLGDISATVSP